MLEKNIVGEHILIIISERIGDAIFCTPAISLLRHTKPTAIIDLLTLSDYSAQVFEFNPDINKVLIAPERKIVKQLAAQYDTIIDLHNSKDTLRYIKWLNKPAFASPRSGKIHQSTVATNFMKSILHQESTDHSEHYKLYPQPKHHETIKHLLKSAGATFSASEKLIGCHMGNYKTAERSKLFWKRNVYSKKTWPIEKFSELQTQLHHINPDIKLVLTGQPSEVKLVKNLHPELNNLINLIGKTSVLELTALMSYLNIFLTGCTGPLHIASATQVPIIALFGPTSPEKTGPHPKRPQHIILQQDPLSNLTTSTVITALQPFLEATT